MTEAQTFHLVDGHAGTAHIDSDSIARKNQTVLGYWDDILPLHNRFKVTILDATHVQLWNGGGYIKGRFFYKDTYTKLEVKAGTNGQKRWDALVLRYHRGSDGVETVTPLIITGVPTSGQPSLPPTLVDNDPYTGSRDADLLLGRVELNGTNISYTGLATQRDSVKNIGVNLQQEITERENAISRERQERQNDIRGEQEARRKWDQVNSADITKLTAHVGSVEGSLNSFKSNFGVIQFRKLVSDPDAQIRGVVVDGMAIISLRWTNRGGFHIGAWSSDHPFAEITNGWKTDFETGNWSIDNSAFSDLWFSFSGNRITFRSRSGHDIAANTWHLCQISAPVHK